MKNITFVLTVAVLTSNYMAVISMDDSLQHVAKFSHPASAPSSAIFSFPEKLETDDSIPLVLTIEHPTSSALWQDLEFCGHILRFSNLSWPALYPRQSRQLHQTKWFLVKRCDIVRHWGTRERETAVILFLLWWCCVCQIASSEHCHHSTVSQ